MPRLPLRLRRRRPAPLRVLADHFPHPAPAPPYPGRGARHTTRSTTIQQNPTNPPPISPARHPRLAVFLLRRYLRAVTAGSAGRHNPPATGLLGVLDKSRRTGTGPNRPGGA
ncbi:hypothetical protein GCM10010425_20450 [Streptomyces spororaveus]|uniref:Uncharacterized protein n=1 Tax=Streptomyces spororaveus TaxID=284039 RepID=A0ABQ3T7Z8_9ACTN|nr:hypothetical protein Sspor_18230 [Streptomyces spororaveus]